MYFLYVRNILYVTILLLNFPFLAEGVSPHDGTSPNKLAQDLSHLELGGEGDTAPPNGDVNNIPLNSDGKWSLN